MAYHRATFSVGSITAIDASTVAQTVDVATVRGITIEFKSTEETLRGAYMAPLDAATKEVDISGKIEAADSIVSLVPLVVPGTTKTTGRRKMAIESGVPTSNTITVTNAANFASNLGVVDLTSGKRLRRVSTAPATGEFSVAAGVYTFAAADSSHTFSIRYSWTDAASGKTTTSTNQAVGATSAYQLEVYDPTGGTREEGYLFPAVKFSNLSGGMKTGEWSSSSFDFTVFADASGKLFDLYSDE